jgi:hypothetical protein
MPKVIEPNYQTVEGLKTHPIFKLLSAKQQEFVLAYIELKGDRAAAAAKVYSAKKPDAVGMRAARTLYIRKLLAIYYGYDLDQTRMGKQELIGLISARIRKADTSDTTFNKLVDNYLELTGVRRKLPPGRPTRDEENDRAADAEPDIDALVRAAEAEKKKS